MGFTIRQLIEETEDAARQIGADAAKRVEEQTWSMMAKVEEFTEGYLRRSLEVIGSSGRNS